MLARLLGAYPGLTMTDLRTLPWREVIALHTAAADAVHARRDADSGYERLPRIV
ncbi:hypothetical protein [Crossiella sp. CA198]|uniref:hypothetical protein n=1 Tax=Crossiella sp. CA198 TaxID=3455607 RepID=UPI003F8D5D48